MLDLSAEDIQLLIKKDELAFARFYESSVDLFFSYLYRHYDLSQCDVDDIVSEVYLKIWTHLSSYDDRYEFGQFVWSILKNYAKDFFKKAPVQLLSELSEEMVAGDDSSYYNEDEEEFSFDVESQIFKQVFLQLDPDSQQLLKDKFIQGYDYQTLAELYHTTPDVVRQRISRIIKKMRKQTHHVV